MRTAQSTLQPRRRHDGPPLQRLHGLLDDMQAGQTTLGCVVDRLGSAATGMCLLMFGLAALIPGVAPVFGFALCAVSLGMVLGHPEPRLPGRLRRWTLDPSRLRAGIERLKPRLAWIERRLTARGEALLAGPAIRLAGVAGVVNGLLIVLPIPLGNTAPAVAVLILALGLIARDGFVVAAGLAASALALAIDAGLIVAGYSAITALVSRIF